MPLCESRIKSNPLGKVTVICMCVCMCIHTYVCIQANRCTQWCCNRRRIVSLFHLHTNTHAHLNVGYTCRHYTLVYARHMYVRLKASSLKYAIKNTQQVSDTIL